MRMSRSQALAAPEAVDTVETMGRSPQVSVIVPVRNGADDLREFLRCLERQTLPADAFEVVIGDDGSTDGGTDGVATDDGRVRVVSGPPRNAYAARNRAVAASSGPILAFVDADCRPDPGWLAGGLAALETADVVAGRIRFDIPPTASVWSLLDAETTKDHERQVQLGVAETANLFVSRELFDRVGGFDDAQPGYGDFEFVARCVAHDGKLVFAADALVSHPVRTSARSFLRNVWSMNSSYAAFESRAGRLPEGLWLRSWVPIVQTLRSRLRIGMSVRLDRKWLGENGVAPALSQDLKAMPINYLLLPYLRSFAQVEGWLKGRRERRAQQVADASATT
jgi:glycosyltransferase involved in cell wall biosynthesis